MTDNIVPQSPTARLKYDKDRECAKCGCERVKTTWDEVASALKRICSRCGFFWHETALSD